MKNLIKDKIQSNFHRSKLKSCNCKILLKKKIVEQTKIYIHLFI